MVPIALQASARESCRPAVSETFTNISRNLTAVLVSPLLCILGYVYYRATIFTSVVTFTSQRTLPRLRMPYRLHLHYHDTYNAPNIAYDTAKCNIDTRAVACSYGTYHDSRVRITNGFKCISKPVTGLPLLIPVTT